MGGGGEGEDQVNAIFENIKSNKPNKKKVDVIVVKKLLPLILTYKNNGNLNNVKSSSEISFIIQNIDNIREDNDLVILLLAFVKIIDTNKELKQTLKKIYDGLMMKDSKILQQYKACLIGFPTSRRPSDLEMLRTALNTDINTARVILSALPQRNTTFNNPINNPIKINLEYIKHR